MTDKLQPFKSWVYPSPDVTQEEAAMILGEPLAWWLQAKNQPIPNRALMYASWELADMATGPLYTVVEEKE